MRKFKSASGIVVIEGSMFPGTAHLPVTIKGARAGTALRKVLPGFHGGGQGYTFHMPTTEQTFQTKTLKALLAEIEAAVA